jgi:hypothetical protein
MYRTLSTAAVTGCPDGYGLLSNKPAVLRDSTKGTLYIDKYVIWVNKRINTTTIILYPSTVGADLTLQFSCLQPLSSLYPNLDF